MKKDIHPNYVDITVTCSCGNKFQTKSTRGEPLSVEVCNLCHPYYTGDQQKIVDTQGRVETFNDRFASFSAMARKKK